MASTPPPLSHALILALRRRPVLLPHLPLMSPLTPPPSPSPFSAVMSNGQLLAVFVDFKVAGAAELCGGVHWMRRVRASPPSPPK
ncbi:hypothetical protein QYE76_033276 [Lolium multiflorum]|uniref:Uncharacterized protein n=1 Tax=Lolium multiflorum TaxID=4521 RepID=A0AAD8VM84_LOLMU|nr:hypothetical protein QYE76_033276 [Lolium multiflorum]